MPPNILNFFSPEKFIKKITQNSVKICTKNLDVFNWISSSFGEFRFSSKLIATFFAQLQTIKTFNSVAWLKDRKIALKYVGYYPKDYKYVSILANIFCGSILAENPSWLQSYGCFKRQWIKWISNLSIHFNEWHEWRINGETRIMSWPTWHQNQLEKSRLIYDKNQQQRLFSEICHFSSQYLPVCWCYGK